MPYKVFISYSVHDKLVADAACATLESKKIPCWIAPRDVLPGRTWSGAIVEAINKSRVMLVIFSSHSNSSHHVIREIEQAVKQGLAILPFRIEDVPLTGDMDYFISSLHWLDAVSPPLEQHLEQLSEIINLILTQSKNPNVQEIHENTIPRYIENNVTIQNVATSKLEADIVWERIKNLDRDQNFGKMLDQANREFRLALEYDRRHENALAIDEYKRFMQSANRIEFQEQHRQETYTLLIKARNAMGSTDSSFNHLLRPMSFTHGKQELSNADKSYSDGQFDTATKHAIAAFEHFTESTATASLFNTFFDSQKTWLDKLSVAEDDLLTNFATAKFQLAVSETENAKKAKMIGQIDLAIKYYQQASENISEAIALTKLEEKNVRAANLAAQLKNAIAIRDKTGAINLLTTLETINPGDSFLTLLRKNLNELPTQLAIELGNGVNMEFSLIPPGSFVMGSEQGEANEKPMHKVTIANPFYLGIYQVTQEQWHAVIGKNRCATKGPKNPVDRVSWDDCQNFINKLTAKTPKFHFSLPTEAQWEYACRAGSTTEYYFGNNPDRLSEYGWFSLNSDCGSHPVGTLKPNAWYLYDMHGNIWEWCYDSFNSNYYASSPSKDPKGPDISSLRVLRGGSYYHQPNTLRSSYRFWAAHSQGLPYFGFRVCATVK